MLKPKKKEISRKVGRMRRKHSDMMQIGKKINDLCYKYGMSSLSLFSVLSVRQLGRITIGAFKEYMDSENPLLQFIGHKRLNTHLEGFEIFFLKND